nr:MAG TPA_asm: hypothetical protein [Caudoviricetes sp.]DAX12446.1 MAG TPA: hypothetical protein [Caudoviricetes sp.]
MNTIYYPLGGFSLMGGWDVISHHIPSTHIK